MQIPTILLPKPQNLFHHRAARSRELALTHASLTGYLNLMAELADGQHSLSEKLPGTPLPDFYTEPPLDISSWQRDSVWRDALRLIVKCFGPKDAPLATILKRIRQAQDNELETWADWLLAGELESLEPGLAPFAAAALQVYWTSLASRLNADDIKQPETTYLCPVCGSLPVAGVLQTGGSIQGLRYLCCGLCATEWNRPRIHCVHCGSSKGVAYFGIEGMGEVVKAEACADCKTYIKLMDREKEAGLDPVADDLASLALDILMVEEGYQRLGFNLLLITG